MNGTPINVPLAPFYRQVLANEECSCAALAAEWASSPVIYITARRNDMSALDEIVRVLGKKRADLASEVHDVLDVGGYLIEPNLPLRIELDRRAVTRTTELTDGIEVQWNGDTVVGFVIRDGFAARSA